MTSQKIKIEKRKLLIVEGKDEQLFFAAALERPLDLEDIQVLAIGGKTKLESNLQALKNDAKFQDVTALAIVRDADESSSSALQAVANVLDNCRLPKPEAHGSFVGAFVPGSPRTGIFIMPDGTSNGMLETLCLRSVQGTPEWDCVKSYFACLENHIAIPSNKDKAFVHAWLSSRTEPDKRLGEAASAGFWPLENPVFESLWEFLRLM